MTSETYLRQLQFDEKIRSRNEMLACTRRIFTFFTFFESFYKTVDGLIILRKIAESTGVNGMQKSKSFLTPSVLWYFIDLTFLEYKFKIGGKTKVDLISRSIFIVCVQFEIRFKIKNYGNRKNYSKKL